jgi:hypothetical protein
MEQLAPRHQLLKRHEAKFVASFDPWSAAMKLRSLPAGGFSPNAFSCRRASAATGACWFSLR